MPNVSDACTFDLSVTATDEAIDTQRLQFKQVRPIIRRVDARSFYVTDYMAEIEIGHGSIIATTLRLEGGMGKQPNALEYNKAGIYLADQVIAYLLDKKGPSFIFKNL